MRKPFVVLLVFAILFCVATAALLFSGPASKPTPEQRGASSYTVKCGNYNRGCTATTTIYGQDGDWNFADRAHALEGWMCPNCR